MKIIFIFTFYLQAFADTSTLNYLYTAFGQENYVQTKFTAVVLLNSEQCMSYNSIKEMLIVVDWINGTQGVDYWKNEAQQMQGNQDDFNTKFRSARTYFSDTKGAHTLQRMYGCELDDDGTTRGYDLYAYDGEDFISLDLTTGTWTSANDGSLLIELNWKPKEAKHWKNYLENNCADYLKKLTSYIREVVPEVSVFHKHYPSPEVVCLATGFFPKPLNITWQEGGEDVHEDVELRETLPNQDGSFQKRSILKVPAEELQKHNYTCVVQHSSLEKELVREVPKDEGTKGGLDGGSDRAMIAIIIVVIIVIVAVVAEIVVWKKKNSGERTTGAVPEGDSSSNNSNTVTVYRPAELRDRRDEERG
ncbi:H-2 class I histocompatibility antigen, alpha chain-like isoform X2 [Clarias gariepinus]|uniref:H-2 class I histocompatibility antigen, alpha chain-like isoform X2 n=1 Tax=Clarias gariepinus TaxID=13013 RepID=UPI00234DB07A|nr:H-2 class I histocompatibility antigen, alpha chain-like isoform X2 [Clarias gariepinus]